MFDIGVNLLHDQFDHDREAVIARAAAAGVSGMLITCTNLAMVPAAIRFAEDHHLYCTAGVHPHDAAGAPVDLERALTSLLGSARIKAIGEAGLDFNRDYSPRPVQRAVFRAQLDAAAGSGLPVFVHDRDSDGEVAATLEPYMRRLSGAVVHCFTGSAGELEALLAMGCYIGITGWICDERRGARLRELVGRIPADRLLIESDAPFLKPANVPKRWQLEHGLATVGRRNEPALLGWVAARIAEETSRSAAAVMRTTEHNARRLFRLTDHGQDP